MCSAREKPVTAIMITNNVDEAILLSDRIVPMTRAPKATLAKGVAVSLSKPRTQDQLLHDEHAERVRSHVIESLTDSVAASKKWGRGSPPAAPAAAETVILAETIS